MSRLMVYQRARVYCACVIQVALVTAALVGGCGTKHAFVVQGSTPANDTIWPEPEPSSVHAFSLGPLPGVKGANGYIPRSQLARIPGGADNWLARPAAASWNTMNLYSRRVLGLSILSGSGDATDRSFARQVYWSYFWCGTRYGCANAATPGTSNHGWARADDLLDCQSSRRAVDRVGGKFGWYHGEAPNECWHVTLYWQGWNGGPDPGIDYAHPRLCHGSRGLGQAPWVTYLQTRLRHHGVSTSSTGGYMTVGTVHAVEAFQRQSHLRPHACTDKATWVKLSH